VSLSLLHCLPNWSVNAYRYVSPYFTLLCYSLEGRPVDLTDWSLLKLKAAALSDEVNRIECEWDEDYQKPKEVHRREEEEDTNDESPAESHSTISNV
jgi:hypothetical protein